MNEIIKPSDFKFEDSEFLVFHWKMKTSMGYDRESIMKWLRGDEETMKRVEACGWLDENGVEIFMARWFKFVDSSRAQKYLYAKLQSGLDILTTNPKRIEGLWSTYLQHKGPGLADHFPSDGEVECYCVGTTSKDMAAFVIDEYVFVGRANG